MTARPVPEIEGSQSVPKPTEHADFSPKSPGIHEDDPGGFFFFRSTPKARISVRLSLPLPGWRYLDVACLQVVVMSPWRRDKVPAPGQHLLHPHFRLSDG